MSRIGKLPVAVPAGVQIKVSDENVVTVKGPLGNCLKKLTLTSQFLLKTVLLS